MTRRDRDILIDDRLAELLAGHAVSGLDADEQAELEAALDAADGFDGGVDDAAMPFARLAAEADLAMLSAMDEAPEVPAMTPGLRERLVADAVRFEAHGAVNRPATTVETRPFAPEADGGFAPEMQATPTSARTGPLATLGPWIGWVAAAAMFALTVLPRGGVDGGGPDGPALSALIAQAGDAITVSLDDGSGVRGQARWSPSLQRGVLQLDGLQSNDPADLQYQIWVVDGRRQADGQQFPAIDGGVFDVPAGAASVTVEIDAKLPIFEVAAVAVTSEPPGGVVKHDPELDPDRYRMLVVNSVASD